MSLLFSTPQAPTPPPPPPPPAPIAAPSLAQRGSAERTSLASASGQGYGGTVATGGQGVTNESTTGAVGQQQPTKSLLGG